MTYRFSLRSIRAGAVAAVAAVVLVGCNGGAEVEDPPTTASPSAPTSSPESSPSPTETESTEEPTTEGPTDEPTEASALPELPEAAKENTPEGAEAFIRHYVDVLNQAHMHPELGLIERYADAGCESCESGKEAIQRLIDLDAHFDGEMYELQSLTPIGGGEPGVQRFEAEWRGLSAQVVSESGEVLDVVPAEDFEGIMAARWEGERWVFYDSASRG